MFIPAEQAVPATERPQVAHPRASRLARLLAEDRAWTLVKKDVAGASCERKRAPLQPLNARGLRQVARCIHQPLVHVSGKDQTTTQPSLTPIAIG